uniref:Uncharacterized protein n=1 Tax=Corethron hystrix TaxID=216773 RepID=A0A7S1BZJ5_9STRA
MVRISFVLVASFFQEILKDSNEKEIHLSANLGDFVLCSALFPTHEKAPREKNSRMKASNDTSTASESCRMEPRNIKGCRSSYSRSGFHKPSLALRNATKSLSNSIPMQPDYIIIFVRM